MSSVREYEHEVWLRWSHDDVNRLKEMRELGVSIIECARRLGRSRDAVVSKLRNPSADVHMPWSPEELRRIRNLAKMGFSNAEIAEKVGRSYYAIRNQLRNREHVATPRAASIALRELGHGRYEDDKYVALCRAQGGFCAYSERRTHRGTPLLCGPITYPQGWGE